MATPIDRGAAPIDAEPDDAPEPGRGNMKATREDWIRVAIEALVSHGVDQVKILTLSETLGVSRSSFYWYFKSRDALLEALLAHWKTSNTGSFIAACDAPATTVTGAVCNLFRCFINVALFDPQLDFAVRDWSRRSDAVRNVVDHADAERLAALRRLFERYGYRRDDATARARILYYMQLGYYALELREPLEDRLAFTAAYLEGFTGRPAKAEEIEALRDYAFAAQNQQQR